MKKGVILLPILLLASCASDFAKYVDNDADFVEVASFDDVAVYSSSTVLSGTVAGLSAHSASLYQDDAFSVSTSSYSWTGFELTTNRVTQYVLIDATTSSRSIAYIYDDDEELQDWLDQAKQLLKEDYERIIQIYQSFEDYKGVSSNDEWDNITLTRAEAGDVLGYTLIQSLTDSENDYYHEIEQYVTFNKIEDKYAIVDYSYRETVTSGITSTYSIAETTFSISDERPVISASLASARYIVIGGVTSENITVPNILTEK